MGQDDLLLVNLSGRGDKDVQQVAALEEAEEKAAREPKPELAQSNRWLPSPVA